MVCFEGIAFFSNVANKKKYNTILLANQPKVAAVNMRLAMALEI